MDRIVDRIVAVQNLPLKIDPAVVDRIVNHSLERKLFDGWVELFGERFGGRFGVDRIVDQMEWTKWSGPNSGFASKNGFCCGGPNSGLNSVLVWTE